jgi:hypothetical protein
MEQQMEQKEQKISKLLDPHIDFTESQRELVEMILWTIVLSKDYLKGKKDKIKRDMIEMTYEEFIKICAKEYWYLDYNIKERWNDKAEREDLDPKLKFIGMKQYKKSFNKKRIVKFYRKFSRIHKKTRDPRLKHIIEFLKKRYFKLSMTFQSKQDLTELFLPIESQVLVQDHGN